MKGIRDLAANCVGALALRGGSCVLSSGSLAEDLVEQPFGEVKQRGQEENRGGGRISEEAAVIRPVGAVLSE